MYIILHNHRFESLLIFLIKVLNYLRNNMNLAIKKMNLHIYLQMAKVCHLNGSIRMAFGTTDDENLLPFSQFPRQF